MRARFRFTALVLLGIVAGVAVGMWLQDRWGIAFDLTYRIVCALACIELMRRVARGYDGERWPWVALFVAAVVNVALLFSPIFDRPASRGEILFFAGPDVVIFLAARVRSYRVPDLQARAVRQQLIVGLVLALLFTALILSMALLPDHRTR